ncbi:MAG: hypothetical protein O7I93_15755 [Gemmatimonadetes bacterium]|nr:hypothetical protein [Gemmatimonadota bacterium]
MPRTTEPEPPPRPTPPPARREVPRLGVPRGHLPSSGMCRVWLEDVAPGRQARQESCPGILADAPAGSWILYRPAHLRHHIRVRYVHQRRSGRIVAVRVYDAQSGRYLQDLALAEDDDNMAPIVVQRTPVQRQPETGRPVTPPGRERVRNGGGNSSGGADTTNAGGRRGNGVGNGNGNGNGRGNSAGGADTAQADTTSSNRSNNGNANNNGRRGNGNANANAGNSNSGNGRSTPQARGTDQEGPGSRGAGADTPLEAGGQPPLSVEVRHFPRIGQCRVWMPGRADSQQARSRSCSGISREAPAGAWILRRSRNDPAVISVDYVDPRRGGAVVKTSVYDATTRAFLR